MKYYFLIWGVLILNVKANSQCTTPISSFPYQQDFELTDGGWQPGGTASDWVWGSPAKPVINSAGQGAKCWVTGGLTNSSYNSAEKSWIQSPCFDFSSLAYPQIQFKIFWETEKTYDGANLQYSVDGGSSWITIGSAAESSCTAENWYNTSNINFLGSSGWSGNIQSTSGSCQGGGGSNGWLTAKHSLHFLAGKSNVIFRFGFAAGTTCNAFDGFAIDDIHIEESPAQDYTIAAACINRNSLAFSIISSCAKTFSWDFGDPVSGANNTSSDAAPNHQYSSGGTYTVSVTVGFDWGPPATKTYVVNILELHPQINWPGACTNIADATITVNTSGAPGPYFYNWNTSPPQNTFSIGSLGAGNYTVTVNANNACTATATYTLTASTPIQINTLAGKAACKKDNGNIVSTIQGGVPPYQYMWSNGDFTANPINLAPGIYSLQVTDANGCKANANNINVEYEEYEVPVNLGPDLDICPGQTVTLSPGIYSTYLWQDGTTLPVFTLQTAGQYSVQVTDNKGCGGADTIQVRADCPDIYFPTGFTPNNDGVNNLFGPLGNLAALKNYRLQIYNRYGQLVFFSTNPFEKWDGRMKGADNNTQSFVWQCHFEFKGKKEFRRGSLVLLR